MYSTPTTACVSSSSSAYRAGKKLWTSALLRCGMACSVTRRLNCQDVWCFRQPTLMLSVSTGDAEQSLPLNLAQHWLRGVRSSQASSLGLCCQAEVQGTAYHAGMAQRGDDADLGQPGVRQARRHLKLQHLHRDHLVAEAPCAGGPTLSMPGRLPGRARTAGGGSPHKR